MNDIENSEISPGTIPQNSAVLENVLSPVLLSDEASTTNEKNPSPAASSVAEPPPIPIPPPTLLPINTDISAPVALNSCDTGSLDLIVHDFDGRRISNISIKVLINKKTVFIGVTDSKGKLPTITGLKQGSLFEIRVKKDHSVPKTKYDDADNYKFAAIGKLATSENFACLQSPKTKFEFSTEDHIGAPGDALEKKQIVLESHNQIETTTPKISGNKLKPLEIVNDRDTQGAPKILIGDGQRDWFDRNGRNDGPSVTNDSDIDHVKKLIAFGEMQAAWSYDKHIVTATYIQRMIAKTFEPPPTKGKDGYKNSLGMCAKYVKIALWYAGFGSPDQAIGNSIGAARDMGPALIKSGFKDITEQIPDARWAAPGDVIVYQKKGHPESDGHIDIRTYDGYLSDFFATYLPTRNFTVTGVYRKYYDPLPIKRMRAFLMVIASQEAKQIFESKGGYKESYKILPGGGEFSSFDTHPFASIPHVSSPSGAYGITRSTWSSYLPELALPPNSETFTPIVQDRIAIAIMDQTLNALGLVRKGEIETAAKILFDKQQWSSLPHPGGKFSMENMMSKYHNFLSENVNGKE